MTKTFLFFIAALSRKENISRVNSRDDGREPTSHLDQPFYSLFVVPYTTLSAQALVKPDTKNRLKKFLKKKKPGHVFSNTEQPEPLEFKG